MMVLAWRVPDRSVQCSFMPSKQIAGIRASASVQMKTATAFLAIAAGLVIYSSLEFMLVEIQTDFSMSPNATIVVAQIAAGASLFAVFLAGALADRLGERRVLSWASAAFCFGAVMVGLSPHEWTLIVGLAIGGVGSIVMAIVGLSVLNKTYPEKAQRARAFGLFAMVAPVAAIVVPLLSSAIIPRSNWRFVTILWVLVGLGTLLLVRRTLPKGTESSVRSELITPALAGIALSGFALAFSFFGIGPKEGHHFPNGFISAGVASVATILLIMTMRRVATPTLDIRTMRRRGSFPILGALFLVNGVNLFFFTYLFLQFRYHQTLIETAVLLILPQAVAGVAAVGGGRLSARLGSARVAAFAFFSAAVLSLGALLVGAEASVWTPVIILTIAAIPIAGSVGPLTYAFMELAPEDGVGSASSVRNAAVNLGIAIAGLITGTIIFNDLERDMEQNLAAYQQQADAFHLAGIFCFVSYLGAGLLVVLYARRRGVSVIRAAHH
jgi:MFS transporter, DHA2 family, methylenomycin A resistance protein